MQDPGRTTSQCFFAWITPTNIPVRIEAYFTSKKSTGCSRAKKMKEKTFEDIDLLRLAMVAARMSGVSDSGDGIGADNNLAEITPTNIPEYAKTHTIWLDKPEPALKI